MERILSLNNDKVKLATALKEKKYRNKFSLFIGEGIRFSEMAADSDFEIVSAFYEAKLFQNDRSRNLIEKLKQKNVNLYEVTDKITEKISNTKNPQGITLVIKTKNNTLNNVKNGNFFVALDGISDPGNLGTIIRLADSIDADGVILLKNSADVYQDKVVRASMGSIFNVPIIQAVDTPDLMNFASENNLNIYATTMRAPSCYEKNLEDGGIFVFGNESVGVSDIILKKSKNISLPIFGKSESLNVAVAASAILYEVIRQKMSKNEKYIKINNLQEKGKSCRI